MIEYHQLPGRPDKHLVTTWLAKRWAMNAFAWGVLGGFICGGALTTTALLLWKALP